MAKRIIIPARYASTRLPGKMLLEIGGKPMLRRVYERALLCGFDSVVIATDDQRIVTAAKSWGAPVCLTSTHHATGTDRIVEAFQQLQYDEDDVIVGLQGDEPFIPVENIQQVAENLQNADEAAITTLCRKTHDLTEVFSPNHVKVVRDCRGFALYFSRAPIPWDREAFPTQLSAQTDVTIHVGIYCYRGAFLQTYARMAQCPLELSESLEQLRALWNGHRIHVDIARRPNPPGVDTEEGLQVAREFAAGI